MKPETTLWDFSDQSQSKASRCLNFLCKKEYGNIWISEGDLEKIKNEFKKKLIP